MVPHRAAVVTSPACDEFELRRRDDFSLSPFFTGRGLG
jgi:hypothetical protein